MFFIILTNLDFCIQVVCLLIKMGETPITEFQASIEVSGRMGSIHHPCKHNNSGVKLKGKQTMMLRGSWKHNKPTIGKEEFFSIMGTFLTFNTKYILGILSINTVM